MAQSNSELSELNKNIKLLNRSIAKANSLRRNLFLSLLKGVATALGATIVATAIIAVLARSIKPFGDIPVIGPLVESSQMQQYLEK